MKGRTVLAVDDDEMFLELIEAVVTGAGGVFLGARSGEDCLEMLKTAQPDMLVLDVNMGGISGTELLARIRADYPKLKALVLFLTAEKSGALIDKAEKLGCNGFILKPITPARLLERLRDHFANPRGTQD